MASPGPEGPGAAHRSRAGHSSRWADVGFSREITVRIAQSLMYAYFYIHFFDGSLTVFVFVLVPFVIVRLRILYRFGSFATEMRYMLSVPHWGILWSFS